MTLVVYAPSVPVMFLACAMIEAACAVLILLPVCAFTSPMNARASRTRLFDVLGDLFLDLGRLRLIGTLSYVFSCAHRLGLVG